MSGEPENHFMPTAGTCALCGHKAVLCESHIVPKFAVKWLRETSATGYLKDALTPNVPKQDARKIRLLCADCEARFSVWEQRFAKDIFTPVHSDVFRRLGYGPWMLKFAVSLSWRVLETNVAELLQTDARFKNVTEKALECWTDFLLEKRSDIKPFEQHIVFLDFPRSFRGVTPPRGFLWYLLRSLDATLVLNTNELLVYTKLPRIILLSPLQPRRASGFKNTRIFNGYGSLQAPQKISSPWFGNFLLTRAEEVLGKARVSDRQRAKITEKLFAADAKGVASSDSFRVAMAQWEFDMGVGVLEKKRKE